MNTLSTQSADTAHTLLDYKVVDQTGTEIGMVHSFWADQQTGMLEFIGVKTGWLFGQNHVVPVEKVEVDQATQSVRVPYTTDFVKGAPSFDADAEISDAEEANIFQYYGVRGGTTTGRTGTETTTTSTTSRTADAAGMGAAGAASYAADSTTAKASTDTTAARTNRTATSGQDIEVPLTEEEVKVGKRTVDAGQVRLRKIVRTEVVNQPVEIRHEDVVVERIAASDVRAGAASDFKEETIDVPLTREEVVVSKDAHVTGAVRLHKTEEAETQNVSETVRKEDVEVVRDGKTVTERTDLKK